MKTKRILLTLIAALLALTLCFSLVGCDNDKKDKDDDDDEPKTSETAKDKDEDKDNDDDNKVSVKDDNDNDNGFGINVPSSSNDAEKIADDFMNYAYVDVDAEKLLGLLHPETFEAMCEVDDMTTDETVEFFQQILESAFEQVPDFEITWEIESSENIDDLSDIQASYDEYDTGVVVDEAVAVNVIGTVTNNGESNTEEREIVVVSIDGDWYLDISFFG